ncbi:MAG TPA: phosphoribosylglycinamide formyltransferase [Longimicrobiales bacterium]|nr:phosphoribosylglycinamide formyltransferase [Longimicrobiales bacterium]
MRRARVAVLASGGGTNLQAILERARAADSRYEVALVVSDRPGAGALARARSAGVPAVVVALAGREPAQAEEELGSVLAAHRIDLVALAGYLRLVPAGIVARYRGRIVNVHPAPLPRFGGRGMYGARVHRAVLDAGVASSGPTVHMVDEEYDRGEVLAHEEVPVRAGDTPDTLAERVLAAEHALYPLVIDRLAAEVVADADRAHAIDNPRNHRCHERC